MSTTVILIVILYVIPMVLCWMMSYREYNGGDLDGYRMTMIDIVGPTIPILNIVVAITGLLTEDLVKKKPKRSDVLARNLRIPPPRRPQRRPQTNQPTVDNTDEPPRRGVFRFGK